MGAHLDVDVRTCATLRRKAWEAVRMQSVVLTYGGMAHDGTGQVGEIGHVVSGHVDEMQACVMVLDAGEEGAFLSMDKEPVAAVV